MATILMVAVALMTEAGFAGNLRYVALPAAFVCVLAGAGWVAVVRAVRRRWRPVVAVALCAAAVPFVAADIDKLRYDWEVVEYEANFYGPNLKAVIAKAGGEQRIKSCGRVFTGSFQVPSVAWRLHIHLNEAEIFPFGPGTALSMGRRRCRSTRAIPSTRRPGTGSPGAPASGGNLEPMATIAPRHALAHRARALSRPASRCLSGSPRWSRSR